MSDRLSDGEPPAESDSQQLAALIRRLVDDPLVALGLLETEQDGALRLHGLLVMFVRQTVADDAAQAAVERAVFAEAARVNWAGYPAAMQPILAHLRTVTSAALGGDGGERAGLCNEMGYHLAE